MTISWQAHHVVSIALPRILNHSPCCVTTPSVALPNTNLFSTLRVSEIPLSAYPFSEPRIPATPNGSHSYHIILLERELPSKMQQAYRDCMVTSTSIVIDTSHSTPHPKYLYKTTYITITPQVHDQVRPQYNREYIIYWSSLIDNRRPIEAASVVLRNPCGISELPTLPFFTGQPTTTSPSLISCLPLGAPPPMPTINSIRMDSKLRSISLATLAADAMPYFPFRTRH